MNTLFLALAVPAAVGIIIGAAIVWDRLREPHRDIRRPVAVVDGRTYRHACRRVERLIAEGDWHRAYAGTTAICLWLNNEQHYGSRARRTRLAADLQAWMARKNEYNPAAAL